MSYQFSFLQGFAGYDFVKSRLLTSFIWRKVLKSLQACCQLERFWRIEILLLADIGEFQTHICQRFRFFQQMLFYSNASAGKIALAYEWCHPSIGINKSLNNQFNHQYIRRLKKFLTQSLSDCEHNNIFDIHIVVWRCKYLLQKIVVLKKFQFMSCNQINCLVFTDYLNFYGLSIEVLEVRE